MRAIKPLKRSYCRGNTEKNGASVVKVRNILQNKIGVCDELLKKMVPQ
jgi:hypothetical protein